MFTFTITEMGLSRRPFCVDVGVNMSHLIVICVILNFIL